MGYDIELKLLNTTQKQNCRILIHLSQGRNRTQFPYSFLFSTDLSVVKTLQFRISV